ncbi:MAG TPA: glycosyltransferase family 8 protein [Bryobacteraceae bacterium]|nr:glycosyltransferase family 8 protein [Bryobacteraceae bacterium]
MARTTLPIACAINSSYALPLVVMLASALEHLGPSYELVLHLVHWRMNGELITRISQLVETRLIAPDAHLVAHLPSDGHFPPEAAFALLLPDLLPQSLDKILFLDADLLVLGDLSQLWELPLSGCALAAVQDAAIPFCDSPRGVKNRSRFGIPENAPYFNAGVMCIQLDEWRRRDITKRAFAYLQQAGGSADFLHQEALNAVLWNDWLPLDPCWNVPGSLAGRFQTPAASNCDHPAIVHFAGRFKPWRAAVGGSFYPQYRAFLSGATKFVPQIPPTVADKLLSFYDRRLRDSLYACERALWNRRLI